MQVRKQKVIVTVRLSTVLGSVMRSIAACTVALCLIPRVMAQEVPYFVTYDHHLEEPGNVVLETFTTTGIPSGREPGQHFYIAPYMEIEYGLTNRLTTAMYWEGQGTAGDSALFTGWRFETRFRPSLRERKINPVIYLEYESVNDASRINKEVVGEGVDLDERNSGLRSVKNHELETKLILSSDFGKWNLSENFIVDKSLSRGEGFEFGYALGVSRWLAKRDQIAYCRFCSQSVVLGAELYGGFGSSLEPQFGLRDTAMYVAPSLSWQVSPNASLRASTAIGIAHETNAVLLRIGYSYEIHAFRRLSRKSAELP
jgi:hypothetical protein